MTGRPGSVSCLRAWGRLSEWTRRSRHRAWRKDGDSWVSVSVGSRLHEELLIWADHVGAGRSGKGGRHGDRVLVHPLTSAKLLCLLQPISLAEIGLDCMKRLKKKNKQKHLDCTEVNFSAL